MEKIVPFLSPVAILLSVAISTFFIRRQMRMNYNLHRREKSLSYSLYSSPHLRDARLKVEESFGNIFEREEAFSNSEIEKKSKKDPHLVPSILTLLAHWENMALAIDTGIADNDVCRDMVASSLMHHLHIFRNLIEKRRAKNPRIYMNLIKLRRKWENDLGKMPQIRYNPILKI